MLIFCTKLLTLSQKKTPPKVGRMDSQKLEIFILKNSLNSINQATFILTRNGNHKY
jgi:hypothetical protein